MMLFTQKGNCSYSLIVTVASIVALVSVAHLFLFNLGPSWDYFGIRQAQTSCLLTNGTTLGGRDELPLDLDGRFSADLHNAVVYRGAPWKAEIGRWFSGCDSVAKEVKIVEEINGKPCPNDCSGQGVCNHGLGQCRCFHGFVGEGCAKQLELQCNYPGTPDVPNGRWVVSICSSHCDTSRAMCFFGEGTKYPNRPAPESCGFTINMPTEPGAFKLTDWEKLDPNIFTANATLPGWCKCAMWTRKKPILER